MKKLLLFAIVILGFSAVSFGQNNGNTLSKESTASARILSVLTISCDDASLHFGTMTMPQEDLTVQISPLADLTVLGGNDTKISLLNIAPIKNVPEYTVSGENGVNFSITFSPSTLTLGPGMTVTNFVTDAGLNGADLKTGVKLEGAVGSTSGEKIFKIGADLQLTKADVTTGLHSANFDVIVAYE